MVNDAGTMESKIRRLRKYEAEAVPVAVDTDGPALEHFSPFGPLISRVRLPPELVDRINDFADTRVSPGQSAEFLVPDELVVFGGEQSLARYLGAQIRRYLSRTEGSAPERIGFEAFWIVSQYAETSSPVHFHSSDLAGVLYLKVPTIAADMQQQSYISGRKAGWINFLIGGKQRLSKSLISFPPEVGDLYIFPGWLLHVAEPFVGAGERRSMAFNVSADAR